MRTLKAFIGSALIVAIALVVISCGGGSSPTTPPPTPFTRTYNFPGTINVACSPDPSGGFSYGFTQVISDQSLNTSGTITITSISVSATASIVSTSLIGEAGLDWEIFIGSQSFGLPTGEISGTATNPTTYSSGAPIQLRFAEIQKPESAGNTFTFTGVYTFATNTLTTNTTVSNLHGASAPAIDVSQGFYVQAFLWNGAPGSNIDFSDIAVTISGQE
ncbi:MAG TPA: hypothetical protein VKQ11_19575 [Candidatus Sulfotelmatobacter sp.]|nr:hypothetical protein [Candidatus Sulfotelmatobacter sp.]